MKIQLQQGDDAPDFDLPADDATQMRLRDFAGHRLVIFFYPKDNTPGCTNEAIDFSRLKQAFSACDTVVIGMSADSIARHQKFKAKHNLTVPLFSDESYETLKAYGVWGEKKLYGKSFLGITRTSFLIDETGKIIRVWNKVRVKGHAEAVLNAVREAI